MMQSGRVFDPGSGSAPVGAKRVPLAHSGLRSASVGAKRVPLAHSGLRSASVGAKRVPLAHSGLRSAPVGAKRVPLAHSAAKWICGMSFGSLFSGINAGPICLPANYFSTLHRECQEFISAGNHPSVRLCCTAPAGQEIADPLSLLLILKKILFFSIFRDIFCLKFRVYK